MMPLRSWNLQMFDIHIPLISYSCFPFIIFLIMPTCWNSVNLALNPPQTLLLCKASRCPRWGRPSADPGTGTSTGFEFSARCYRPQSGSSLDRRSPRLPTPMSTEHDSPSRAAAWREPRGRSLAAPSPGEGEHYPPAWSFHLWWILWQIVR